MLKLKTIPIVKRKIPPKNIFSKYKDVVELKFKFNLMETKRDLSFPFRHRKKINNFRNPLQKIRNDLTILKTQSPITIPSKYSIKQFFTILPEESPGSTLGSLNIVKYLTPFKIWLRRKYNRWYRMLKKRKKELPTSKLMPFKV